MSVGKLTGPKKAAILLLALGEDAAADVLKNLEEIEIQQVGYFMTRFTDISPEEVDIVLEEFYRNSVTQEEGVSINSSPDFIRNALNKALGPDRAKELADNLSSTGQDSGLDALRFIEPVIISNYIRTEHPQTIALVLSYLNNIPAIRGASLYTSATLGNILNERRKEFFGEGLRFYDLARTGQSMPEVDCGIQLNCLLTGSPPEFGSYRYAYPISKSERDANPNVQQNAGY